MANKIDRTGEIHITNEGYPIKIIACRGSKNCDIQFENGLILYDKWYKSIKAGRIKNPYHASVYGVGYIGIGEYEVAINRVAVPRYNCWKGMLERCYSIKSQEKHPTYKETSVYEEWKNYQVFSKWYEQNWKPHMEGWHLDKDILIKGNKIYSPETCCLVPRKINNVILTKKKLRDNLPIGVHFDKKSKKYIAQFQNNGKKITIGLYNSIEEAFHAYKTAKEAHIKEVADEWKPLINEKVYKALYNWKIEITD